MAHTPFHGLMQPGQRPSMQFQQLNQAYQSDPRRILGQALMGQGASSAPVRTPLQGLGRLSSALVGAYLQRKAGDAQVERETEMTNQIMGMLGPNVAPNVRAAVAANPASAQTALLAAQFAPTTSSELTNLGGFTGVRTTQTNPITGQTSSTIGNLVQPRAPAVSYQTLTDAEAKAEGFDTSKGQKYQRSSAGATKQIGATPATTNITVDMAKESNKSLIEKFENLETAATASRTAVGKADQMLSLLDQGVDTGFGSRFGLSLQQVGQFFNPNYAVKEIAGKENFLSASNELVLPRVKQLGYNPTDADLKFINEANPLLTKSIAGNRLMLQTIRIVEARNIALFQEANRFIQSTVTEADPAGITDDPMGRFKLGDHLMKFQENNPLFTEATKTLEEEFQRITGIAASAVQPASVVDDLITRGLISE
jgi:hypothetical protein